MSAITDCDLPAEGYTEGDIINARRVWHRHRLCRHPNSGRCGWCRQPWIREKHGCPARYQAWRVLDAVGEFDAQGQLRARTIPSTTV